MSNFLDCCFPLFNKRTQNETIFLDVDDALMRAGENFKGKPAEFNLKLMKQLKGKKVVLVTNMDLGEISQISGASSKYMPSRLDLIDKLESYGIQVSYVVTNGDLREGVKPGDTYANIIKPWTQKAIRIDDSPEVKEKKLANGGFTMDDLAKRAEDQTETVKEFIKEKGTFDEEMFRDIGNLTREGKYSSDKLKALLIEKFFDYHPEEEGNKKMLFYDDRDNYLQNVNAFFKERGYNYQCYQITYDKEKGKGFKMNKYNLEPNDSEHEKTPLVQKK